MSIAEQAIQILECKGDIKAAIESKGVTVGDAPLSQYASKIGEIRGDIPDPSHDYSQDYLTFEALDDGYFGMTIGAEVSTQSLVSISYSLDNGTTWTTTSNVDSTEVVITTPSILKGHKVIWKGLGTGCAKYTNMTTSTDSSYFSIFFSSVIYNVSGNIQSLLLGDNFVVDSPNLESGCFACLFKDGLVHNAKNLILTKNVGNSYYFATFYMSSIAYAPELPATELAYKCYSYMFSGCTSLAKTPDFKANALEYSCYDSMFSGCKHLKYVSDMPTCECRQMCYYKMFYGCSSLESTPKLTLTELGYADCCSQMFYSCTSLKVINITFSSSSVGAQSCLSMFNGCTSLTTAPELPATTVSTSGYKQMFQGCTSLVTAPELPATLLGSSCYYQMFQGCTSLLVAPVLSVETLVNSCYYRMFYGCINLERVTCLATNISASNCTNNWVNNVSATGTFIKAESMESWTTGVSGIPSGWVVYNDSGANGEPD